MTCLGRSTPMAASGSTWPSTARMPSVAVRNRACCLAFEPHARWPPTVHQARPGANHRAPPRSGLCVLPEMLQDSTTETPERP
jgi:hypothetical protein